MVFASCE
jgi:hypothetical protein